MQSENADFGGAEEPGGNERCGKAAGDVEWNLGVGVEAAQVFAAVAGFHRGPAPRGGELAAMGMTREHQLGAMRKGVNEVGFVPENDHREGRVGFFERGVRGGRAAVGAVDSYPFDAVLVVDLVKEEARSEGFDNLANVVDVAAVVIAVSGDDEAAIFESGEVSEGVGQQSAVGGNVPINEVATDDDDVGVLFGEPI